MSGKRSFFAELRRRHIFRIAIAYAVTAWLLIQLAAISLPAFGAPHWIIRVVIGLLILFFPVALILAWAFEVTPEGVRRTVPASSETARPVAAGRRVGRVLNAVTLVALATAVGVLSWQLALRTRPASSPTEAVAAATKPAPASATAIPADSIAVLPFLDLSPKGNQGYFAEGMAEQLLDILAQSTKLEVAARTSAFQFKGEHEDVTKIGKLLRVRHVLEGSVRRDGDLVRITVQLINARTDYHEWSKTYQRKMTDVFKVQDEISKAIADTLEVKIGAAAGARTVAQADPPADPGAYDEYLLGRHLVNERTGESLRAALVHFKKAIALDPDYAPAYAQTAISYSLLRLGPDTYGNYTAEQVSALARPFLRRAVKLAPDAPDTLAAQGLLDGMSGQSEAALQHFSRAVKTNPSYMDAVTWLAQTLQYRRRYPESLAVLEAGVRRDPLNWILNDNYMYALLARGRFEEAREIADRFLSIDPAKGHLMRGDVQGARGKPVAALKNYLAALAVGHGRTGVEDSIIEILNAAALYKESERLRLWNDGGFIAALAGDKKAALAQQEKMLALWHAFVPHIVAGVTDLVLQRREQAGKQFDLAGKTHHDWTWPHAQLAYVALLREAGENKMAATVFDVVRKSVADHHAKAAAAGVDWPDYAWLSASIKFLEGERDAGLAALRDAVEHPSFFDTIARPWHSGSLYLKRAPQFDSVRSDPRFQAIVELSERQEADLRARLLPVLCNWHYPAGGWHPLPSTCAGVPEPASSATPS